MDLKVTASAKRRSSKLALANLLSEVERRQKTRKLLSYFPDTGPLRRELYPKHMRFFELGLTKRQRLMLAANRIGKTESVGLYEVVLHATGVYPKWWKGKKLAHAPLIWCAGDSSKTVRDILVRKLLGAVGETGTGLIPGDSIIKITQAPGVRDSADSIYIRHSSGSTSCITLKSYDQKRKAFQGAEVDIILLDEEPPEDIYTECLTRTMTTQGLVLLTFTPLSGMSNVVLSFLEGGQIDSPIEADGKAVVMAGWDDVPHLTQQDKDDLLSSIPPFQRNARSKGIPQLGSGAIFPVAEDEIKCEPFAIPVEWPRAYGLDVGWNRTAAVWGALNPEDGTLYIYSEHYRGEAEPVVHASSIKSRGSWMTGAIDPASDGRAQTDGKKLLDLYRTEGLKLVKANNAVDSGLLEVWGKLSTGKIKVFSTLQEFLKEYRLYRRDEKGNVVKKNDHLMDAFRYLVVTGTFHMKVNPKVDIHTGEVYSTSNGRGSWAG